MGRRSLSRWALLLASSVAAVALVPPAQAQRVVPKLQVVCPMGYVDTFNGKCSTLGLMTYIYLRTKNHEHFFTRAQP